ncbi:MAG TPA: protein kinase [Pyrinomonadaceae bacterium]|nr:protein kinase [Pyrinomonadaceae bacterium]
MRQSNRDRIQDIYLDAVELPESERAAFVESKCDADPGCIRKVNSLLDAAARPGILDSPVANFGLPVSLIGKTIDTRYKIERKLPHGGMSEVYVALDQNLDDKQVVIKILSAELLQDSYARQHFDQEVEAMLRIKNAGVVDVSDRGSLPDGRPYIVMQYVDGETLRSQIPNEGMDLRRAASIIKQVGVALEHIHQAGIFHRDVKPENIMLRRGTDSVVLIDFGIARVMDSVVALSTVRGSSAGTLAYMSPEQLLGEKVFAQSDIYSMAVVAYEMITGRRPFSPTSPAQMLELQRKGVRAKPTDLRSGLSKRAQDILLRALEFEPSHRYKSAVQFADELAEALNESNITVDFPVGPGIRKWLKVFAGVAIIAVLAYLAYIFVPPPIPPKPKGFNYWLTVQRTVNGKDYDAPFKSNGNEPFHNGDKFQLSIQSLFSGYIYVFNERLPIEGSASLQLIYPNQAVNNDSSIGANHTIQSDWIVFDGPPGTDNYWIVWSASPLAELETAKNASLNQPQASSTDQNLVKIKEYLRDLNTEVKARAAKMTKSQEVEVRKRTNIVLTFAEFKHR